MLLSSPSSSFLEICSGCIILTHSPHSVTSFVCRYNDGRVHMHHVIRYDNAPLPSPFPLYLLAIFCGCCAAVLPSYQRSQHAAPPTSQPTLPCNIFIRPHDDWSIHHVHISNRRWPERNLSFPSADCEAAICGEDMVHCRRSGSCFCFRHLR